MEISRCNAESPRLQFIIVLRVIIVHFCVILMKLMQVNLYDLLQRFYKTCEIDCKGNDFF